MKQQTQDLLNTARRLSRLIEERAVAMNVPVTITVVDVHGNLVLKERMPGAALISLEMSEMKAYTAVALGRPTKDITKDAQPGGPLYTITSVAGGRYVAFGGGVPLRDGGALVAGVGVSGGTTEEDIEIVEGALSALTESR
jgi:uncharacterized protein GlcG (DUF336 family)